MLVYREDRVAIKSLGGMSAMVTFPVVEWDSKGTGRFKQFKPLCWAVPENILTEKGITPISEDAAMAIREKRHMAGKKASGSHQRKIDDMSEELGLKPGSRTAEALLRGEIDEATAERIAERCRSRHEETDYDDLLKAGYSKEDARLLMQKKV